MVTRLKILLDQAEFSALLQASMMELRNPADQARFIVRSELIRRGLLKDKEQQRETLKQVINDSN